MVKSNLSFFQDHLPFSTGTLPLKNLEPPRLWHQLRLHSPPQSLVPVVTLSCQVLSCNLSCIFLTQFQAPLPPSVSGSYCFTLSYCRTRLADLVLHSMPIYLHTVVKLYFCPIALMISTTLLNSVPSLSIANKMKSNCFSLDSKVLDNLTSVLLFSPISCC